MPTQEQIDASIARSQAKAPRKADFSNADLVADSGLNIAHFQREDTPLTRDITVAYEVVSNNLLKVATSMCHPSDTFTKKFGTRQAIENFQNGNFIDMPRDKSLTPYHQIGMMFGAFVRTPHGFMSAVEDDIMARLGR